MIIAHRLKIHINNRRNYRKKTYAITKKSETSANIISTHRSLTAPRSARRGMAEEWNQADTSAPTNRIAAGSWRSLKSVGRRGYGNVI